MKTKLLIILSLFYCAITIAQEEDYLIFNVVVKDSYIHTGGINNSFWIMKIEDIDNVKLDYEISPLYLLDDLSRDAIVDCLSNKEIDLFTTTINTNRNFEEKFITELTGLELLLNERVCIQKITKNWRNKRKAKVSIYVTPIRGSFNICKADSSMRKRFDIPEKIFIPNSNFKILDFKILERDDIAGFLFYADFSKYTFANRVW